MGFTIKEPCHEDWTKMTPSQKGAFCQKCALDVIDFTHKTPIEIKQLLIQEFSEQSRTCGRITNYQLDQLNDEFFQWKSEKETFRAIWMFSLLAVFGLTLFSCQNTLSKEMISKLNMETSMMLNPDTVSVDLSEAQDSLQTNLDSNQLKISVGPWRPDEIVTYMGIMPLYEVHNSKLPWVTCVVSMGDIAIYGNFLPAKDTKEFLAATTPALPIGNFEKVQNEPVSPIKNPPRNRTIQNLEGIVGSGEKKFDSFVSPNPITSESRLFVHAFEPLLLSIGIHVKDNEEAFRSGIVELSAGNHSLDLKLNSLNSGAYELKLFAFNQLSELVFSVPQKVI